MKSLYASQKFKETGQRPSELDKKLSAQFWLGCSILTKDERNDPMHPDYVDRHNSYISVLNAS